MTTRLEREPVSPVNPVSQIRPWRVEATGDRRKAMWGRACPVTTVEAQMGLVRDQGWIGGDNYGPIGTL